MDLLCRIRIHQNENSDLTPYKNILCNPQTVCFICIYLHILSGTACVVYEYGGCSAIIKMVPNYVHAVAQPNRIIM